MNYDHEDDPPKPPPSNPWSPLGQGCFSCRFSFRLSGYNLCRRFPPVSHSGPTGDGEWSYPKIRKNDWCGEWADKQ